MACVKVTEMHSQVCQGPRLIPPEINYSKNSNRWEIKMAEQLTDGK